MILVTGGTGFVGQALVRSLSEAGYPVRLLIRPSSKSPQLPKGVALEVAVTSLNDPRGLRAAMVGVDTIFHLAGVERRGAYANLLAVDIQGTRQIVRAAAESGVDRLVYVSHLGADRASAYPVLKAKAIAEDFVRRSGVDFTIMRAAIVFGPRDGFTTGLARLLYGLPFVFFIPGKGDTLLQPLWVEDLATCLTWALEDDSLRNQMVEIGGPEYFTFNQILELVMETIQLRRRIIPMRPPYLRALTVFLESLFPGLPVSVYWLDYLATNRTCSLDTIPRQFSLMPARLPHHLGYLRNADWQRSLFADLRRRRRDVI